MNNRPNVPLSSLLLVLLAAGSLHAQQCSTRTTNGRYLVRCDGYLTPGPSAPQAPASFVDVTLSRNAHGPPPA